MTDHEQMRVRLQKREELIASQVTAYPVAIEAVRSVRALKEEFGELQANEQSEDSVFVAGRVMRLRHAGRISFLVIQDSGGNRVQGLFSRATIGDESHAELKALVDLGDFIELDGNPGASSTGEFSIFVNSWRVISKALRPLPNQHDALSEETRSRQRYLEFLLNEDSRNRMRLRSKVIAGIRQAMDEDGFMEVETPMLQIQQGGATARPFSTHSNALDADLYLRIAPELFLKRAVVGGFHRVFEINRNFRNEGMDATHSPEFTMMEAYQAYADYNQMADLVEGLIRGASAHVAPLMGAESEDNIHAVSTLGESSNAWARISLYESLSEALNREITPETELEVLVALGLEHGIKLDVPTPGKLVEELWEELVKPALTAPTFVFDYPVDSSPLVAPHRSIVGLVEKWDLYIDGFEIATGYSELVDPVIQRERLEEQARLRTDGDDEAMRVDEDFLEALEHGMPPTGGIGIGIDRLLMVLSGRGIRDTVLFPLVK